MPSARAGGFLFWDGSERDEGLKTFFERVDCKWNGMRAAGGASGMPNLAVPVSCVSAVVLIGCDANVNPPKCRSARVTYRDGCEEVVVEKQ